jgi:hypothetical protein
MSDNQDTQETLATRYHPVLAQLSFQPFLFKHNNLILIGLTQLAEEWPKILVVAGRAARRPLKFSSFFQSTA